MVCSNNVLGLYINKRVKTICNLISPRCFVVLEKWYMREVNFKFGKTLPIILSLIFIRVWPKEDLSKLDRFRELYCMYNMHWGNTWLIMETMCPLSYYHNGLWQLMYLGTWCMWCKLSIVASWNNLLVIFLLCTIVLPFAEILF